MYAIGDMYLQLEIYDTSLMYFERSFELVKKLLSENDSQYENTLSRVGVVYYKMGITSKALELF